MIFLDYSIIKHRLASTKEIPSGCTITDVFSDDLSSLSDLSLMDWACDGHRSSCPLARPSDHCSDMTLTSGLAVILVLLSSKQSQDERACASMHDILSNLEHCKRLPTSAGRDIFVLRQPSLAGSPATLPTQMEASTLLLSSSWACTLTRRALVYVVAPSANNLSSALTKECCTPIPLPRNFICGQ